MASQVVSNINGAGTVPVKADLIGPRKARAGARKPLGDLTNAAKPANRADGKKALDASSNLSKPKKNLSVLESNATKTSGKSQTSNRKALSDISNSGKPLIQEMKSKKSSKPSRVRDLTLDEIAEEMCSHDHQKCVKSQLEYGSVDVHQFFKTLEDDLMNDGLTIYSPPKKVKSEIEIAHWELEELPEELPEMRSPVRPGTPASSSSSLWDSPPRFSVVLDLDDLKLIDSPI